MKTHTSQRTRCGGHPHRLGHPANSQLVKSPVYANDRATSTSQGRGIHRVLQQLRRRDTTYNSNLSPVWKRLRLDQYERHSPLRESSCDRDLHLCLGTRRFGCCHGHPSRVGDSSTRAHVECSVLSTGTARCSCGAEILPDQRNFNGCTLALGHSGNYLAAHQF
jgi:hypothetical protein